MLSIVLIKRKTKNEKLSPILHRYFFITLFQNEYIAIHFHYIKFIVQRATEIFFFFQIHLKLFIV